LDVRATRAAFAAGTLSTVRDHPAAVDEQRLVETGDANGYDLHVVSHEPKSRWTEAERQAFLARAQYVDPRERRA
jgi:hypothetical protein